MRKKDETVNPILEVCGIKLEMTEKNARVLYSGK
jgi:hypothetical protein